MVKNIFLNYWFSDKGRTIALSVTCSPLDQGRRKYLKLDGARHFEGTFSSSKHKILLDDYKVRPELNKHKNI